MKRILFVVPDVTAKEEAARRFHESKNLGLGPLFAFSLTEAGRILLNEEFDNQDGVAVHTATPLAEGLTATPEQITRLCTAAGKMGCVSYMYDDGDKTLDAVLNSLLRKLYLRLTIDYS